MECPTFSIRANNNLIFCKYQPLICELYSMLIVALFCKTPSQTWLELHELYNARSLEKARCGSINTRVTKIHDHSLIETFFVHVSQRLESQQVSTTNHHRGSRHFLFLYEAKKNVRAQSQCMHMTRK